MLLLDYELRDLGLSPYCVVEKSYGLGEVPITELASGSERRGPSNDLYCGALGLTLIWRLAQRIARWGVPSPGRCPARTGCFVLG